MSKFAPGAGLELGKAALRATIVMICIAFIILLSGYYVHNYVAIIGAGVPWFVYLLGAILGALGTLGVFTKESLTIAGYSCGKHCRSSLYSILSCFIG